MAVLIENPAVIEAAGTPPKTIAEYFGKVRSGESAVSIARMSSPPGWEEPAQRPSFDEYTVVLAGTVVVETEDGAVEVRAGQAIKTVAGERVRYSTPGGAEYLAVCIPAFTPEGVNRE